MSGIEVVGVVLGVMPLIIEGLERYAEGISTAKRLFRPERELRRLRRRVNAELQIFRNTTRSLLVNITNDAHVTSLIDNPKSPLWQNAEFEEKLKRILGSSYRSWYDVMEDMNKAVTELTEVLGLPLDVCVDIDVSLRRNDELGD